MSDVIVLAGSHYYISLCCLVSEITHFLNSINRIRRSIIYKVLLIIMIGTIAAIIMSPHCHTIKSIVKLLFSDLIAKYFFIAYAYLCLRRERDLKSLFKLIDVCMILITIFAIHNYITKQSIWFHMIYPDGLKDIGASGFEMQERFRVQSMFVSPFNYGFICVWASVIYLYQYCRGLCKGSKFAFFGGLCILGMIICGCRLIPICWIIGYATFLYFITSKVQRIKYSFWFLSALCVIYFLIPDGIKSGFYESYSHMLNMDISSKSFDGGSSIAMRIVQVLTVFSYIQGHWLFGRGVDFFNIDLGWADRDAAATTDDLWGMEGIHLSLLLERGFFGLFIWLYVYYSLFVFFHNRKKYELFESSLGISLIVIYMVFSLSTGELGSSFATLFSLGLIIKMIEMKDINCKLK